MTMYQKCLMQVSGLRRTGLQPDALPSELTRHESFVRDSNPEPTAYKAVALSSAHEAKASWCA